MSEIPKEDLDQKGLGKMALGWARAFLQEPEVQGTFVAKALVLIK